MHIGWRALVFSYYIYEQQYLFIYLSLFDVFFMYVVIYLVIFVVFLQYYLGHYWLGLLVSKKLVFFVFVIIKIDCLNKLGLEPFVLYYLGPFLRGNQQGL